MKALSNPLVCVSLGLLLGIGAGLGTFWRQARVLLEAAQAAKLAAAEPVRPEKPWDFWTLDVENLAAELKAQTAALAEREKAVRSREERLENETRELEKTRRQIEALRAELAQTITELEADEMKNLKTLAKTYSELTPKAAVGILREMDDETVVKLLFLMKTDVVSPLLQEMGSSPDAELARRAAAITEKLRLVKAPKPANS